VNVIEIMIVLRAACRKTTRCVFPFPFPSHPLTNPHDNFILNYQPISSKPYANQIVAPPGECPWNNEWKAWFLLLPFSLPLTSPNDNLSPDPHFVGFFHFHTLAVFAPSQGTEGQPYLHYGVRLGSWSEFPLQELMGFYSVHNTLALLFQKIKV